MLQSSSARVHLVDKSSCRSKGRETCKIMFTGSTQLLFVTESHVDRSNKVGRICRIETPPTKSQLHIQAVRIRGRTAFVKTAQVQRYNMVELWCRLRLYLPNEYLEETQARSSQTLCNSVVAACHYSFDELLTAAEIRQRGCACSYPNRWQLPFNDVLTQVMREV